ncbi:MAG: YggT family protein [Eubacteriales bacterium]|nr:YggT family protein [Eubacteriales bacterium]
MYLIFRLAISLVVLLQMMLVIRALMSWFPQIQQSRAYDFVYTITEPLVQPFRVFLSRFESMRTSPIDFSSMLAFLVLCLIQELLQVLY